MSNPAVVSFSNAVAATKSGVRHAIGLLQAVVGDSNTADPNWLSKYITVMERTWDLLAMLSGGAVVQFASTGLTVDVYAANYQIGATRYTYAGGTLLLTGSATNYVYLDADQTPKTHTTAFPADVFRLAIVTTDGSSVTANKDARSENFRIGSDSWWNLPAEDDVDLDGYHAINVGGIAFDAPTTLAIASGVITPTQEVHTIDTEALSASDDLVTITPFAEWPRRLILRSANGSRSITILGSGNIVLAQDGQSVLLSNPAYHIELLQYSATHFVTIAKPIVGITQLVTDVNAANKGFTAMKGIAYTVNSESIASGVVDGVGYQHIMVDTEGGASSDDLTTMQDVGVGELRIITIADAGRVVTVKHGTGSEQFRMAHGRDFVMNSLAHTLVVRMADDGVLCEVARSHWTNAYHEDIPIYIAGTPSAAAYGLKITLGSDAVIRYASGQVGTAPSGTAFICDVRVNGSSIFASQAEMINIAAGATSDTSAVKNHVCVAGDVIDIEPEVISGAANFTATLHLARSPQATP